METRSKAKQQDEIPHFSILVLTKRTRRKTRWILENHLKNIALYGLTTILDTKRPLKKKLTKEGQTWSLHHLVGILDPQIQMNQQQDRNNTQQREEEPLLHKKEKNCTKA